MSNFITPPSNLNLNLQNNHPLIPRENTFWLNRKVLTIHSQDRDISKWPFANEFEIELPQDYHNVQSSRLLEITFPVNLYNFSNINQNTIFRITINNDVYWTCPMLLCGEVIEISIDNGYYTKEQLINTLTFKLNEFMPDSKSNNKWKAVYHETKQKILIGNNNGINFTVNADVSFNYANICCNLTSQNKSGVNCCDGTSLLPPTVNYFDRYNKFGFLAYIGFTEKRDYPAIIIEPPNPEGLPFNCSQSANYLPYKSSGNGSRPQNIWLERNDKDLYYVEPPSVVDSIGEQVIYMEMDYFNNIDELIPWSNSANEKLINGKVANITFQGKPPFLSGSKPIAYRGAGINSSFAKIPLLSLPQNTDINSTNGQLLNSSQFTPPLERINRLKFKFRYHDGQLVDFKDSDLTFSLEFNMLRNDFDRKMNINQPTFYSYG